MYPYKHLLVILSLSDQSKNTLRYAGLISRMAKSEKVYFVHFAKSLDIPKEILKEYPDLLQPVGEYAKSQMEGMVDKYFDGLPGIDMVYEVLEGSPLALFLRRFREYDIDLVLVGKEKSPNRIGMLPEKIARKAPCSVLIIPEGIKPEISKILISVDFSENSANALNAGIQLASASGLSNVICLHVYSIPPGYYKIGLTRRKLSKIVKTQAERNYNDFIGKFDFKGLSVNPIFVLDNNPAKAITKTAKKEQADLIIIGDRGRGGTAILLGDVTERLISIAKTPILVVKKKATALRLLDALLKKL